MNPQEINTRIQQLLDGEISAEQFSVLEAELRSNPEALAAYRSHVSVHCGLQDLAEAAALQRATVIPINRVLSLQKRRDARIAMLAIAAVLTLATFLLWHIAAPSPSPATAEIRSAPGSFYSMVTDGENHTIAIANLTQGASLRLEHGSIELKLPHSVRAVVDAPATLSLLDDRTLELKQGRALFEVPSPKGHGFTVTTGNQRITDLGTVFGVFPRHDSGLVELHVFDGKVRASDLENKQDGEVVSAPRAVILEGGRIAKDLAALSNSFRRKLPNRVDTILAEDFENGLLCGQSYAVHIEPTAVLDKAGNPYPGIPQDNPWHFSTSKELRIRNAGFESAKVEKAMPVPHWREVTGATIGFNTYAQDPKPTEGSLQLQLSPGLSMVQDLEVPIRAGTTYTLTLDVGRPSSEPSGQAVIHLFGRDSGMETPFAELIVSPDQGDWWHNQRLVYTATAGEASGQSLCIALAARSSKITFDNLRIFESEAAAKDPVAEAAITQSPAPAGSADTTPPAVSRFHPLPDATSASPDTIPSVTFDEPVHFGPGSVVIHNLNDGTSTKLFAGSRGYSIENATLALLPPLGLKDGSDQIGSIPGWRATGPVRRFNPDGKGYPYLHPHLSDNVGTRGALAPMKGPLMVSLGEQGEQGTLRRPLGTIETGRTYTASIAIGSRNPDSPHNPPFAGYRIRLLCGDQEVASTTGHTPPGPPNSVTPVGFTWDSREFPAHLPPDSPLVLEISSLENPAGDSGYLDITHVRVTSIQADEH